MRHRPLIAGAAALALVVSLAACGGDDGDDAPADPTTTEAEASTDVPAETTEAADDPSEATTEPDAPEGSTDPDAPDESTDPDAPDESTEPGAPAVDDLTSSLLTAADLGDGFAEGDYATSEDPGPCGISINDEYPSDAVVGTVLVDEERQLFVQHEIRTYADAETADLTLSFAMDALSCGADTTTPGLVLDDPVELSDVLGAPSFIVSLTVDSDGVAGALIVAEVANVLSVFQYQGPADVSDAPDIQTLITDNVAALQATLG